MSEIQCGWLTEGPILAAPEYSVFSYTEVLRPVQCLLPGVVPLPTPTPLGPAPSDLTAHLITQFHFQLPALCLAYFSQHRSRETWVLLKQWTTRTLRKDQGESVVRHGLDRAKGGGVEWEDTGSQRAVLGPGMLANCAKTQRHQERSHSPEIRSGRLTLLTVATWVGQKPQPV